MGIHFDISLKTNLLKFSAVCHVSCSYADFTKLGFRAKSRKAGTDGGHIPSNLRNLHSAFQSGRPKFVL